MEISRREWVKAAMLSTSLISGSKAFKMSQQGRCLSFYPMLTLLEKSFCEIEPRLCCVLSHFVPRIHSMLGLLDTYRDLAGQVRVLLALLPFFAKFTGNLQRRKQSCSMLQYCYEILPYCLCVVILHS